VSQTPEDEEAFRALLDGHGLLRPGALRAPAPEEAYTVFAQRTDVELDTGALRRNAERFFGTTLGPTVQKRYQGGVPEEDAIRLVVAPSNVPGGVRLCFGRPATGDDWARARAAETACGAGGLADLAERCRIVWLVRLEAHADPTALLLATILASALLGPIVPPDGSEIFGVRTARMRLDERPHGYR
jgi:hypothetical protein